MLLVRYAWFQGHYIDPNRGSIFGCLEAASGKYPWVRKIDLSLVFSSFYFGLPILTVGNYANSRSSSRYSSCDIHDVILQPIWLFNISIHRTVDFTQHSLTTDERY